MQRYLVGADPAVLAVVRVCLPVILGQFSIVPETGNHSIQVPNRLVIETTPEDATRLRTLLAGIGVVELDSPLDPLNPNVG